MELAIRLLIYDVGKETVVGEDLKGLPVDVDMTNVLSFLTKTLGESQGLAWTSTEDIDEVEIGWVFDGPAEGLEAWAIPVFYDNEERDWVSVFLRQEQQRREFEELYESGFFDELKIIAVDQTEWRPGAEETPVDGTR